MKQSTCIECGNQRKRGQGSAEKQLCSTCYSRQWRANNKITKECAWCGSAFKADRHETNYCGFSCAGKYQSSKRPDSPAWRDYQAQVQANKKPKPDTLTQDELRELWKSKRSPLRAAFEEARWGDFISHLEERCELTTDGCWEWQGQQSQSSKSKSPYPVIKWTGRVRQVHRLALEAKHGAPLGTQQAHHTCANTMCVNPEHLQPATHVENIAEMKARASYEARINELETALATVAPHHPLLSHINYGT